MRVPQAKGWFIQGLNRSRVKDIFLLAKTSRPTMANTQPLFSENWVLSCG